MALIECPECSNDVSSSASACPRCGFPVAKNVRPPKQFVSPVTLQESADASIACQSCGYLVNNVSLPCPSCGNKVYFHAPSPAPYIKPPNYVRNKPQREKQRSSFDVSRLYAPLIFVAILSAILYFGRDYYDDALIIVKDFLKTIQNKLQDLKIFS